MESRRVHPKGFKLCFHLYHGFTAVGFILLTGFGLKTVTIKGGRK